MASRTPRPDLRSLQLSPARRFEAPPVRPIPWHDNPAEGVRVEGAQHKAGRAFTREEADKVVKMEPPLSKQYPQWIFPVFSMLARYTGARIGEIAVLEAKDAVEVEAVRCLRLRTEKVRSRGGRSYREEYRFAPIAPKLASTIDGCLRRHPTGQLFPHNGQWKWKQAPSVPGSIRAPRTDAHP